MIEAGSKLLLEIEENFFQAANSQAGLMPGNAYQGQLSDSALQRGGGKSQFEFGTAGGTIGRNSKCELALNSSSVSSRHAQISLKEGGFYLEDLQSRNGTRVNGKLLLPHIEYRLSEGEQIQIASCRLTVLSITIPILDRKDTHAPVEPIDEAETQVVIQTVAQDESHDSSEKAEAAYLKQDNTPEPLSYNQEPPNQELSNQEPFNQELPNQNLPKQELPEQAPAGQMALPEDWMNQSGITPKNRLPEGLNRAVASTSAEFGTPAKPIDKKIADPRSSERTPPSRSSSSSPTAENYVPRATSNSASNATTADLAHAFFEGLGVDAPEGFQFDKEGLKQLGKAVRVMTEGTSELLAARSFLKFAINANMTQFNTNPLKMGLKTDEALEHLMTHEQKMGLDRPASFKGIELAFKEAFGDLKMHEMGLLGGFQTTLQRLLAQLSPEHIESTLASRQGVMKNLPVVKEVRLWEVYRDKYGELQNLVGEEGKPLADDDLDKDLIEVFADDMLDGYLGTIEEMVE